MTIYFSIMTSHLAQRHCYRCSHRVGIGICRIKSVISSPQPIQRRRSFFVYALLHSFVHSLVLVCSFLLLLGQFVCSGPANTLRAFASVAGVVIVRLQISRFVVVFICYASEGIVNLDEFVFSFFFRSLTFKDFILKLFFFIFFVFFNNFV